MSEILNHLAIRIRNELSEIKHTLKRATEGMKRAKQTGDDYYLDGVALKMKGMKEPDNVSYSNSVVSNR